ncbi:MAG: type II secretion system F family protein [Candidatus Micrarchaeota archaeon]|nr:type II secretion system F family protein [Candidatus Micrarchaeota archaeon]
MAETSFLEIIGRVFFSRAHIRKFENQITAAGFTYSAEAFAGWMFLSSLILAILATVVAFGFSGLGVKVASFILSILPFLPQILLPILAFVIFLVAFYILITLLVSSLLLLHVDARRNALESVLPDFLLLVAANIKAGLALDQAMWYSAKPEFGLLSHEVKIVIKDSFSGESLEKSLDKLASRFDSKVFQRTMALIKQSSASGGEIAAVLTRTSEDVRSTGITKKEVASSLILYEIFILFASTFGTPFLFAVAGKLVEVFEKYRLAIPSVSSVNTGVFGSISTVGLQTPIITSGEFFYFSLAIIFLTSLFSSFIVGVIKTGSRNEGLKYFPFVCSIAYVVYFLVNAFFAAFFFSLT